MFVRFSISDYSVMVENAWFMFYEKNVVIPTHEVLFIPTVNMSRSSHYNYNYKTQKTALYELMIAKCYNYDLQFNYCYWITIFWTLDFGTSKYGRDHFQFLRLKLVSDLSCFNKKKSFGFPSTTNLWNFVLYIIAEAFKEVLPR